MLFVALLIAAALAGDIEFSRTITDVCSGCTLVIDIAPASACTSRDAYGSNDCSFNWGSSYTIDVKGDLPSDIEKGSKMVADLKVSIFPWKFECALCGATCEVTVPIVGKKISIPFPDCPIKGRTISRSGSLDLPADSPVPIQAELKGDITFTDQNGRSIAKVTLDAKLSDVEAHLPALTEALLLTFAEKEFDTKLVAEKIRKIMNRKFKF